MKGWISTKKFAELAGTSYDAIRMRVRRGNYKKIRYIKGRGKAGRVMQIHRSELLENVSQQQPVSWSIDIFISNLVKLGRREID